MKGTYLGEFEEIVLLTIGVLHEQAYGVSVLEHMQQQSGRSISIGALHTTLARLEQKGFIRSFMGGATKERGGRRKRYYSMTLEGKHALQEAKRLRDNLWLLLPRVVIEGGLP